MRISSASFGSRSAQVSGTSPPVSSILKRMPSGSWDRIWPKAIAPLRRRSMVLVADSGSWAWTAPRRRGKTAETRRARRSAEERVEGRGRVVFISVCSLGFISAFLRVLRSPRSLFLLGLLALDDARAQALAEGDLAQEQRGELLRARRPAHRPLHLDVDLVLERVLGVRHGVRAVEQAGIARDLLLDEVARQARDLVAELVELEREERLLEVGDDRVDRPRGAAAQRGRARQRRAEGEQPEDRRHADQEDEHREHDLDQREATFPGTAGLQPGSSSRSPLHRSQSSLVMSTGISRATCQPWCTSVSAGCA